MTAFLARAQAAGNLRVTAHTGHVARLVVSELVTNAGAHAPGPCRLDLAITGDALQITVGDTSPALPVAAPHHPARIGGHGLEIARILCRRLEAERHPGGKHVRAHLALDQ